MSINKWSPPAGGTGMGGNSSETLLPVTRPIHSNEGGRRGRGGVRGGGGGERR